MAQNILVLPGDGIGQEVMTEVRRVVDWFGDNRGLEVNITYNDKTRVALTLTSCPEMRHGLL